MSLLAVDMGSSSCKAVALSTEGRILAERSNSYAPDIPKPSWAEMPAEKFWNALQSVTRAIADGAFEDPIEALSISSHAETFVAVNQNRQPVSPAILNMDNRAMVQANWMAEALGPRRIFEITGLAVHPMYPIPKILWMRENQKDTFSSAAQYLGVTDYLLTRLGQEIVSHSQVLRSRRERVFLVLAHPQNLRNGIHGMYRQSGDFKDAPWPQRLCHPVRLNHSAVVHIQNGGRHRLPVLVYRNERLCMRADGESFNRIFKRAICNRSSDALKGIPEFLRGHFGPGWLGNVGRVRVASLCKDAALGRECDRLAAA